MTASHDKRRACARLLHAGAAGLLAMVLADPLLAAAPVLQADFRPRPPEMFVDAETGRVSGPLVAILEDAAASIGYRVNWRVAPFPRSLQDMRSGHTDIVPRVIDSAERRAFIHFLGPIGWQQGDILFLVRKGEEQRIRSYADLAATSIGIKRGTLYFERFDRDPGLRKVEAPDDANLVNMFRHRRFDTMIVLDRGALEGVLKEQGIGDYAFAEYKVPQRIAIYYGLSKQSSKLPLAAALERALRQLQEKGEIARRYQQYGLPPP